MPVYEYECEKCRHRFEERRFFDSDPEKCPECGGKIRRLISLPAGIVPTGFSTRRKHGPAPSPAHEKAREDYYERKGRRK